MENFEFIVRWEEKFFKSFDHSDVSKCCRQELTDFMIDREFTIKIKKTASETAMGDMRPVDSAVHEVKVKQGD